jgi:hypothetical protein
MSKSPLAEVFGYPPDNNSDEARRYRKYRLCPYNNCVPSCTKDKAQDPLGVCTVNYADHYAITCPVRFRENWIVADDAANYFFPPDTMWTSLTEIRLNDANGRSAGNIDVILVSYDSSGRVTDFGAVEVQGVYISGNVRNPFAEYMRKENIGKPFTWTGQLTPRPDYLSSSRKRLVPQVIFKGGILNSWGKKMAVVIHEGFFDTLPDLPEVEKDESDIAWLVYGLQPHATENRLTLVRKKIIYTRFEDAISTISYPLPGIMGDFVDRLQEKLERKLEIENTPETNTFKNLLNIERE